MKIKDIPVCERPREKLLKYGVSNMSDAELLSIVFKTGTKDLSAIDLSYNVLNKYSNFSYFKDISFEELVSIKGIGSAKAVEIIAISEISKRMYYSDNPKLFSIFKTPFDIYNLNKYLFDNKKQELFYCLYLDSKKRLIKRKLLFMGTLNKSVVHPREIFKEAYKISASSIICLHNHPSGDINPSYEDINLTNSLIEIGKINGIPVVDHIIFGDNCYYSFYENGRKDGVL